MDLDAPSCKKEAVPALAASDIEDRSSAVNEIRESFENRIGLGAEDVCSLPVEVVVAIHATKSTAAGN